MIVRRTGRVALHTPIIEQGSGMLTAFQLLTAAELSVPCEQIDVEQTMEGIEYDRGVGGSRVTRVIGKMIGLLATRLKGRLAQLLAAEFGYDVAAVAFEAGSFRTPDGRLHSMAEAASLADSDLTELLRYELTPSDLVETYAAVGVEVRLDRETGYVEVLRAAIAHETGKVINPVMYQGQIDGGLVQGLGFALTEGMLFDEGHVTTLNLHEYKLPCAADVPRLQTLALPPDLSLGITPIGEGPNVAMSSAIACAIIDVVGRPVDIPVRAEALMAAVNADEPPLPLGEGGGEGVAAGKADETPLPLGEGGGEGVAAGSALTRRAPAALRRRLPEGEAEYGSPLALQGPLPEGEGEYGSPLAPHGPLPDGRAGNVP
jgi:CO/xanthine dehydrogenase Mo-binding subunit